MFDVVSSADCWNFPWLVVGRVMLHGISEQVLHSRSVSRSWLWMRLNMALQVEMLFDLSDFFSGCKHVFIN